MTRKLPGDLVGLTRSARDERAKAEAETRAKVDGRTLRNKGRSEQIGVRITPQHRQRLERLSQATGKSFSQIFEDGIEVLEKELKGK